MTGAGPDTRARIAADRRKYYEELVAKIEDCDAQKRQKWKEIHDMISNKEEMEIQEEFLGDLRRHQLHNAKDRTMALARTTSEASKLANKSSSRVKELDEVKARVLEALELVEGITSQQNSVAGVSEALAAKEYETAVSFVTRYFETEKQLKNVQEVADLTSTAASAQVQMERDKLQEAIRTEFKASIQKGDEDAVIRFSKLFRPLDMCTEGLGMYIKWIRESVATELQSFVKDSVKKVETKDGDGTYLAILSRVLDTIAATLENEEHHIGKYFGAAGSKELVMQLNQEASTQMLPVLNSVATTAKPFTADPESADPPEIDQMMDEIAHISQTCHVYYHFITERYAKAVEEEVAEKDKDASTSASTPAASAGDHEPKKVEKKKGRRVQPAFVAECEAMKALQTVLGMYIPLQRDYFHNAFTKAAALDRPKKEAKDSGNLADTVTKSMVNMSGIIRGDETDDESSATGQGTALIEDVFYMLRISCHRVIQCRNPNIISAVLNIITDLLRGDLLGEIQRNVRVSKEQARPSYKSMQWINNLERSAAYIQKLYKELSSLLQRNKRGFDESEFSKITEVSFEIKVTADTFGHHRESYLHKVIQIVEAQIKARGLAEFDQLDYRITEAQFLNNEINDPWALNALQAWDMILDPFRKGFNDDNFEELIMEVVNFVTAQLEAIACQKAFTQYGGLQLDKDVRAIRNYFTQKTEKPVRDKFTRLSHIGNLLSIDKVSEMYDLWGSSSGSSSNPLMWRLTSAEVKVMLALRVDFEKTAINALKLK